VSQREATVAGSNGITVSYTYATSPYFTVRVDGVGTEIDAFNILIANLKGVRKTTPGGSEFDMYTFVHVHLKPGTELKAMSSTLFGIAEDWLREHTPQPGQHCQSCGMRATKIERGTPACELYPTCGPGN